MPEIDQKYEYFSLDQILVELHFKNQSRMNQGWSFHDLYPIKYSAHERFYVEPTFSRKVKTKKYNCYDEREMERTECLNHFYMSKLNCTFPWLESTNQSQEKCGSKHFIKDLVDLINEVSTGK